MSDIDHEAAKELAQKSLRIGSITDLSEVTHDDLAHATVMADHPYTQIIEPIAHAYLDLHAQLAAERARVARIRQALTAWAESPHYVFDTQGEETPEWLALNQAIYDNAHAQGDEG